MLLLFIFTGDSNAKGNTLIEDPDIIVDLHHVNSGGGDKYSVSGGTISPSCRIVRLSIRGGMVMLPN